MNLNPEDIRVFSKQSFQGCRGSHDWDHTLRVYNLCLHIGEAEGADLEVLKIAAYLHDVGRKVQDDSKGALCHAEEGATIAAHVLKGYPLSAKKKGNIIRSIRSHRFRDNHEPETLEAKVLFDADKLDSIGAIGIARAFQFAGEVGARLHNSQIDLSDTMAYSTEDTAYREFRLKLSKIKDRMFTAEGSRMAKKRHELMEEFFRSFLREYAGCE